jgi:predicted hydrocarbon binding protein
MASVDWFIDEGEKDISSVDLMIKALVELNLSAFDELVKLSGPMAALAAVQPYRIINAKFLVDDARRRLNIRGNGPDALLFTHVFASLAAVPPGKVLGEVRENGAVGINRNCIYRNGSPEFCMSISHYYTEGEAVHINPDYECVWTHHETGGDPYCRYVFKKKSDPISILDDLGNTVFTMPEIELPNEEAKAAQLWGGSSFLDGTTKAFVDLHGPERTREVLGANAERVGRKIGQQVIGAMPELATDIYKTAMLVRTMQHTLGQKDDNPISIGDGVSNTITDCSQQVFTGELCKQYESFFNGMISAMNPDYAIVYDQMITQGDEVCHWTIKHKETSKKSDSPLAILKSRLAKGEIGEEEYRRLKQLVDEQ